MSRRVPRDWRRFTRESPSWQRGQTLYERWLAGESQTALAKELGVTRARVWNIVHKQQYFWDNR